MTNGPGTLRHSPSRGNRRPTTVPKRPGWHKQVEIDIRAYSPAPARSLSTSERSFRPPPSLHFLTIFLHTPFYYLLLSSPSTTLYHPAPSHIPSTTMSSPLKHSGFMSAVAGPASSIDPIAPNGTNKPKPKGIGKGIIRLSPQVDVPTRKSPAALPPLPTLTALPSLEAQRAQLPHPMLPQARGQHGQH